MEWLFLVLVVLGVHCVLYFLDSLFQSCQHLPYLQLMRSSGLHIGPLQLHWTTSALNRAFQKWGGCRPRLLRFWFSAGAWASSLLLAPGLLLLLVTALTQLRRLFSSTSTMDVDEGLTPVLTPVIPGVNLPGSHLGQYLLALLACSAVHEVGHALAAVREGVPVLGCGLLVLVVLPAAFVELSSQPLRALHPSRRLRVLGAGVWHNLVLAAVTWLMLLLLPLLLAPVFHHGKGVLVCHLHPDSGVSGPMGLQEGDHVLRVDQCPVMDTSSWHHCLARSASMLPNAFCVPADLVHQYDESVPVRQLPRGSVQCCAPSSPNHLCFEHLEGEGQRGGAMALPQYSCLPARKVLEGALGLCGHGVTQVEEDGEKEGEEEGVGCMRDSFCLRPSLDNSTRLVQVQARGRSEVLYLGSPWQLVVSVRVSDYVPRRGVDAEMVGGPLSPPWPETLETLLRYVVAFSLALALLNVVPCVALDGQHLTATLLEMLWPHHSFSPDRRRSVANVLVAVGTFLVGLNLLLGLMLLLPTAPFLTAPSLPP